MFMPRDAMQDLINWKENPRHKPLLLNGARQVGKTELALRFGHENFQHVAYLQLDSSDDSRTLFHDFDMQRILIMCRRGRKCPSFQVKHSSSWMKYKNNHWLLQP